MVPDPERDGAETSEPALDSTPTYVDPTASGLEHQEVFGAGTKPGGGTKPDLRAVLDDLVASLNARLGSGRYSIGVEVRKGNVDLTGLPPAEPRAAKASGGGDGPATYRRVRRIRFPSR